jgi:DNA-binding SARP family transcriptional activator
VLVVQPQTPLINVLGTFEWCGNPGGRLSPRQRIVVSALVLGEGLDVDSTTLIERVWGDAPPPTARKALQVHIVAVRNVLGAERVATTGRGYRLVAEAHEVDAWYFEELVRSALRAPELYGDHLAQALSLWRGTPYPDLDAQTAAGTRVRLEELRAVAIDRRAELLLDKGAVGDAVRLLEPATHDDPLRERRWALLMVALHRAGRRVESLRAYQRARDGLAQAAGLEPGRLLRVVERLVLDDDPRLWVRDVLDDPETLANLGTIDTSSETVAALR